MDGSSDFQYFVDKQGNAHSAGYVFDQTCIQSGGNDSKNKKAANNLAVPGGLFYNNKKTIMTNISHEKGVINSFIFDKLFTCSCDDDKKSNKSTRKNSKTANKKTRRV